MKNVVYVTNFPPANAAENLKAVFEKLGPVAAVVIEHDSGINQAYALVTMVREKDATRARNTLNGEVLGGSRLAVSPPNVTERAHPSSKQQETIQQIASALGETEELPLRQLTALVMLCGTNFAEALLRETEMIEAQGGILTSDGQRRRTKGGVFFYLARFRMSKPLRVIIYNRKGKLPQPAAAQ